MYICVVNRTLGLIDENGILTLHAIPESQDEGAPLVQYTSKFADFARKEVWDLKFSSVSLCVNLIAFNIPAPPSSVTGRIMMSTRS